MRRLLRWDLPAEAEGSPPLAVGRDQRGRGRAASPRDDPMSVADQHPVRAGTAVRSAARRRSERRERLERPPVPAVGRTPPEDRPRGADPAGDHPVVADGERQRVRDDRRVGTQSPRLAGVSAPSASDGRRPTIAPPPGRDGRPSSTLRSATKPVDVALRSKRAKLRGNAFRGATTHREPSDEVAKRAARPLVAMASPFGPAATRAAVPLGLESWSRAGCSSGSSSGRRSTSRPRWAGDIAPGNRSSRSRRRTSPEESPGR